MRKIFFKSMLLLCTLIVGTGSLWGTPTTYSFSSIPTGWTTSGGSQTINGKSWTYSSSTYIGENSGKIQVGSKNNPQTSNWTIQTAISNFGDNKAVSAVSITAYTTATTATYDISVGGSSVKSGNLTTSSATYSATGLNATSGDIVVTLTGSSTSKAMYLSNISVTYDDASTDPVIGASNVEISAEDESGEFNYTISNPVNNTHLSATITAGGTWLSNATVDEANGKVTFESTINEDMENSRVGTIHLIYGDNLATKDVSITQAAMPAKYTVTYTTAQTNGTLTIKNGDDVVTSGSKFPVGTILNIVTTPDENYVTRNWQYRREGGNWTTVPSSTTYTMTDKDVEFRASFDLTYPVNFNVNGQIASTARFANGKNITFPASVTAFGGYEFVGWAASAINGSVADEPTLVNTSEETMGTAEKTYYAVYGQIQKKNVQISFDASDISNLTESATRTWVDNSTGIKLYISNGQRYTNGTPNTWSVTKSTNTNDYYLSIGRENCAIKKVVTTISGSDYPFGDYYAYESISDENGIDLSANVTSSNNVYTWPINGDYEQVILWTNYDNQARATLITVDAVIDAVSAYLTSIPTTATITINAACTDGYFCYGTFSFCRPFVVSSDIVVSEIGIDGGELLVESYNTGDVVPANTGVMVAAAEGGNYVVNLSNEAGTSVLGDDNRLRPSGESGITADAMAINDAGCKYYRLTMHNGTVIGFWWGAASGAAFDLAANKAYLAVPADAYLAPSRFWIVDEENNATNIENVEANENAVKFIENGKLLILREGITYDALGRVVR